MIVAFKKQPLESAFGKANVDDSNPRVLKVRGEAGMMDIAPSQPTYSGEGFREYGAPPTLPSYGLQLLCHGFPPALAGTQLAVGGAPALAKLLIKRLQHAWEQA